MIVRRTLRELNRGCGDDTKDVVRHLNQVRENRIDTRSMIAEEEAGNRAKDRGRNLEPRKSVRDIEGKAGTFYRIKTYSSRRLSLTKQETLDILAASL